MELLKLRCPKCESCNIESYKKYQTKNHGIRTIFKCQVCFDRFSETKNTFMENSKKPISVIWNVINNRTEGQGLNAAARVANVAKNTILSWEWKFAKLHEVLFVYSLVHEFLQSVVEGDELYTKVGKNVPPDQSSGWTLVLMDRASRFIWELSCGEKNRELFENAIETLKQVIEKADDICLFTDGERRYGNLLFETCYEIIKNGKPGRPKKTLKQGVKVRLKNKGSQSHKKGPKRPKYQSPCPEHPETKQEIENKDIHANHVEAFNSSLRRKCSAFRRKTNTYAKEQNKLQRILDVYWVVHNFVRVHFTTKRVPAMALGVIDRKLSISEIFLIRML